MTRGEISESPSLRDFASLWLPVVAWAGLIFYFSSLPNLRITQAWYDLILRKLAHAFVFAVLAILSYRACSRSASWPSRKTWVVSFMGCVLYAVSDEFHQSFVPGRRAAFWDVLIDASGVWAGLRFKQR